MMASTIKATTLLRNRIASIEDELRELAERRADLKQQSESLADELAQHKEALNILVRSVSPTARRNNQ
ncbi:MAG: hypothetical protein CMQ46_05540 [Gammaproteobacteria bacterium]|nr:hypothetical protein [Gammaproteobacteria bacterium]MBJ54708.1 hypothetical protein [Gammaproteobacteria bacterium]|tara:strand:- start:73 stop:276 length:204 start_codon:yes stop_codon:yes gene_type:complete